MRHTGIRTLTAACCTTILLLNAGCETVDTTKVGPDGIQCPIAPLAVNAVYIDIVYAADGTPSVAGAQTCGVQSGATITWRTKPGETRPFQLVFKEAHPAEDDGKRDQGGVIGDRYKYRVIAEKVPARTSYKYGIRANGKEVDPEIIIDPPK